MLSLRRSLGEYLRHIEQLGPRPLGPEQRPITIQDSQFLRETLKHDIASNDWIIRVAIGLLICLFALGVYLILYNTNSIPATAGKAGGTLLALMAVIRYLLWIWSEKSKMVVFMYCSYILEPKQMAKLATSLYFKSFDTRLHATEVRQDVQSAI
jgi:hypothetical protein